MVHQLSKDGFDGIALKVIFQDRKSPIFTYLSVLFSSIIISCVSGEISRKYLSVRLRFSEQTELVSVDGVCCVSYRTVVYLPYMV